MCEGISYFPHGGTQPVGKSGNICPSQMSEREEREREREGERDEGRERAIDCDRECVRESKREAFLSQCERGREKVRKCEMVYMSVRAIVG